MKDAEIKELLSKNYFLCSGLASFAFHSFPLSLLLWNVLFCVVRLHHKCLWINHEMVTGDLGTDRGQDSLSNPPPHAPPVFRHSLLFNFHSPDSTSHWGKLSAFSLPRMSQILCGSKLVKEGTLAWNQKPKIIWSFIHLTNIC